MKEKKETIKNVKKMKEKIVKYKNKSKKQKLF